MWHPLRTTERAGTIANYILRPDKERRTGEITNPRTSEVYLNYAEACYFSGDIANAQKYLNEVRSHVNLAPKNHTGSQLFEDIMNERHLEFGMEGFRFFDVVRVGWGEKVFNGTKKAEFGAKTPFSAGAEVLPIPQTEIDISDGLITN